MAQTSTGILTRFVEFQGGIFALLFRALRMESRSIRIHLVWFFLLVVIDLSLISAQGSRLSAPGLEFFTWNAYLNLAFISLLGIGFISNAITEEKEEDTLGLMLMAGISPLGILLGKSASRMIQVLILLAVQYPFTLLAVTLGGLTYGQITSAYLSLFSFTILLANIGLLSSVLTQRSRDAAGLTFFGLVLYSLAYPIGWVGYEYLTRDRLWQLQTWPDWTWDNLGCNVVLQACVWMQQSHVLLDIGDAMKTGYQFSWSVQKVGNLVAAAVLFLISWGVFSVASKDPSTEATPRGLIARPTAGRRRPLFSAGRAWDQSLVWKDFHFAVGGVSGFVGRCLLYFVLFQVIFAFNLKWHDYQPTRFWDVDLEVVLPIFIFIAHLVLAMEIALVASRVLSEEVRSQTLSSLLMLPKSIPEVFYSKLTGCVIGLLPGVLALFAAIAAYLFASDQAAKSVVRIIEAPIFWWWIIHVLFVIHLTMVLSLYVRWGAFVLSVVVSFAMYCVFFLMIAIFSGPFGGRYFEEMFVLFTIMLGIGCPVCHSFILMKLPKFGEK